MKTQISYISIIKSYTVVTDVCQAVGRCAREGMSPNNYLCSIVFMKFLTLFRKKKTGFADNPLWSCESLPKEIVVEGCAVKSA